MKSKTTLMLISVLVLLMGIAALVPSWDLGTEPAWHSWLKIIVGVVGLAVAYSDKSTPAVKS